VILSRSTVRGPRIPRHVWRSWAQRGLTELTIGLIGGLGGSFGGDVVHLLAHIG
jgi:hypothetical protein